MAAYRGRSTWSLGVDIKERPMLKEYKRTTNIGVGFGWLVLLAGNLLMRYETSGARVLGLVVSLVGAGLFLWGCGQYAKAKGHSAYWGALGLLNLVGLLVLLFFPDKHKTQATL
jgi:hypothetical protein